ncbi:MULTISPECIES: hypothetical protein [Nocardia]|uniref:hypothetical protein n=1 Tax=Nocardia TaxID=1817 RepID=UPI000D6922A0|nr:MULTISPECIES: hypothetical protein [Nocardia]
MGSHPSVDIFYGYDLGGMEDGHWNSTAPQWWQDAEDDEDDYEAWDKALARRLGWEDSTGDKARYSLMASVPVEVVTYGYCEGDTYWCVQVKASVQDIDGGDCERLRDLTVRPEWAGQLAAFMGLLELPVPEGRPGWHVNCSYG